MHIHPTKDAGRALIEHGIEGPVTMLNLLRFREVADYAGSPELAPPGEITGAEAYRLYMEAVTPLLTKAGGELLFRGDGGPYLIGPMDARWDLVLLVKHQSVDKFLGFAMDPAYLAIAGHRTAALSDSRLLPIT